MILTSSTSAPTKSLVEEIKSRYSISVCVIALLIEVPRINTSYIVADISLVRLAIPIVELHWGSKSMRRVLHSVTAKPTAIFTADVVLPTPPF